MGQTLKLGQGYVHYLLTPYSKYKHRINISYNDSYYSKGERKGITNRESHKETGLDKQWNSYIYEKQGC